MNKKYKNKNEKTLLEVIFVGFFKGIWWLIQLAFGKKKARSSLTQSEKNQIINKRLEIEELLGSNNQIELTHALFEADKLVDHVLRTSRYRGETFADRLRSAEQNIDPEIYNAIWQGHKVRNQLAHESSANTSLSEIKSAIVKLLRFLKNV